MDELEISGKRYISTKRAGKDHKYHADYIGQLIRGKKVAGQKVGRAWYVDADSLAAYLGSEAAPRDASEVVGRVVEKAVEIEEVAPEVETVVIEEVASPEVAAEIVAAEEVPESGASYIPIKIEQPLIKKEKVVVEEDAPVFYRTTKEAREARSTRTGLRYITDEGPLLPPIQKNTITIRKEAPASAAKHVAPDASPVKIRIAEPTLVRNFTDTPVTAKRTASKKTNSVGLMFARAGVVVVLGAAVFAVAAFASTHLLFTETLNGGQGASAGYSIK